MDASEQYIKMRLAAIADLGMGKPPESMGAEEFYSFQTTTVFIDAKGDWYYSTVDEHCQLERQDELQAMVIPDDEQDSSNKYVVLLDDFQDWVLNDCSGLDWSYRTTPSMEQLWLAFYMSEKHNKYWDGSQWVIKK